MAETNETKQKSEEKVFWSRAKSSRIANFVKEERDGSGRVSQPEGSIRFFEHIYVTSNPAEIEFILKSTAFENGDVRECANIEEARKFTLQHDAVKYAISEEKAEHNESTIIQESGTVVR